MRVVARGSPTPVELAWALFSALLVAAGVVKAYVPLVAVHLPSCVVRTTLGVRCPTCGTGTSLSLLARGRIVEALHANWLAVALVAALLGFDVYLAATFAVRRKLDVTLSRRDAWLVVLGGLAALALAWIFQGR